MQDAISNVSKQTALALPKHFSLIPHFLQNNALLFKNFLTIRVKKVPVLKTIETTDKYQPEAS